jgi:type II secretory ATPase GspE/PulE/Tfp pilus assembly ATPase PilB-like protein
MSRVTTGSGVPFEAHDGMVIVSGATSAGKSTVVAELIQGSTKTVVFGKPVELRLPRHPGRDDEGTR